MALNPEEFHQRRQERAQRRAQRQARQRKLILYLAVAGVVLLACGLLIIRTTKTGRGSASTTAPQETVPNTVIHLAAAGDLNITDGVVNAGGADFDYTETFLDVAPLLADPDLTVLNFEGNLCGAPYGSATGSAPQGLAESLRKAGVDVIQLANSYSINKGLAGLVETINTTRAAGLEPLGVYESEAAYKSGKGYIIREVEGVKIALVAFTKGMDGMALPENSTNCVNLLYTDYESTYQNVDREKITKILDAAASEKPDLTVAMLHWGSEFNDTLSASQNEIVKLMQEHGVDAIIGTHSHYVQKMTLDKETGMFVAYSLGDFFGDGAKSGTQYSVILDLEITKNNETGETKITGYSFPPISTVNDGGKLRVVRIAEAMSAFDQDYLGKISDEAYVNMQYALERIENRITVPEESTEPQN